MFQSLLFYNIFPDSRLLRHVREVSQDKVYDSIEFNEFLLLVSKHQEESLTRNSLLEAFRVFDPSGSGSVSFDCFHGIMSRSEFHIVFLGHSVNILY